MDLGFVLDSSGSLRNDYQTEKDFLKSIAAAFGISADGPRAGVITFSYHAEHSIKMKDHTNASSFNEALDAIPLMGSITKIDKALRLAQKELFIEENGGRPDVNKILVLLTDGSQTQDPDAEDPNEIADELREAGITILAIGVGPGINEKELNEIAGGGYNAFTASSFKELLLGELKESARR